jgi:hypothetical protein
MVVAARIGAGRSTTALVAAVAVSATTGAGRSVTAMVAVAVSATGRSVTAMAPVPVAVARQHFPARHHQHLQHNHCFPARQATMRGQGGKEVSFFLLTELSSR